MLNRVFYRLTLWAGVAVVSPTTAISEEILASGPAVIAGGIASVRSNTFPPPPMSIDANLYFGKEGGLDLAAAVVFRDQGFTTTDIGRRFEIDSAVPGFNAVAAELSGRGAGRFFFELKFSDAVSFSSPLSVSAPQLPVGSTVSSVGFTLADLVFVTDINTPALGFTVYKPNPQLSMTVFGTVPEPGVAAFALLGSGASLLRKRSTSEVIRPRGIGSRPRQADLPAVLS